MQDWTPFNNVQDSSLLMDSDASRTMHNGDYGLKIGIVAEIIELPRESEFGGFGYKVDVQHLGKEIPIICYHLTKLSGPHNFEEFSLRPWVHFPRNLLPPAASDDLGLRAGDKVVIAALDGNMSQGVILGTMRHHARKNFIPNGDAAYLFRYNGLDKEIRQDGTYKVTWRGLPINDQLLNIPPTGANPPAPVFNPSTSGSFYGFDNLGSYTVADGNGQLIKIKKLSGNITLVSGDVRLEMGRTHIAGSDTIAMKTTNLKIESEETVIKGSSAVNIDGQEISLNGKVSIGLGPIELLDTLIKLIDELGNVTVTSPVGTCTPILSSPNWAAVTLLKLQIEQIKGGGPQIALPLAPGTDQDNFGDDIIT